MWYDFFVKAKSLTSDTHYKQQVRDTVAKYKRLFPQEYVVVVHAIRTKAAALYDTRFGTADASKDSDMRALYEIPETLSNMLIHALDADGLTWFSETKASYWFAKTFPEFRLPDQI